ncbi:hypothetical protein GJ744_001868 [Endocarpon pusillum]|uniref:Uncharacterized protein n=1 Tax=Endocarpon pusillum TaxID=364733 RepID=A0A8H7AWA0_9EURO|nr:hypothetical protein GJ744_001868 [Endocarpon pusillum]
MQSQGQININWNNRSPSLAACSSGFFRTVRSRRCLTTALGDPSPSSVEFDLQQLPLRPWDASRQQKKEASSSDVPAPAATAVSPVCSPTSPLSGYLAKY